MPCESLSHTAIPATEIKGKALASISASFDRFCLAVRLAALAEMMERDALETFGVLHESSRRRAAPR
jgi:hypothetical protein